MRSNPDALAAYAKLAGPAITAAGGKILARGEAAATKEEGLKQRTVLIEFESVAAALAAYDNRPIRKHCGHWERDQSNGISGSSGRYISARVSQALRTA